MFATYLLLLLILINFALLTKGTLKTEVGMTLTAIGAVILAGPEEGTLALEHGFGEFSHIAVLFTAIAVPAHILARSEVLDKIGMRVGEFIGGGSTKFRIDPVLAVTTVSLVMTYVMAATLHNTTSILIAATIVTLICKSYGIPVIPVLAGTLIASNLGGFSTRWGDTPNIIEAEIWGLDHGHFFGQILPINLGALTLLIAFTTITTKFLLKKRNLSQATKSKMVYSMIEFRSVRRNIQPDKRLVFVGVAGLLIAIIGSLAFPKYELTLAAFAIMFCVLGDYKDHRTETLFALGLETYATLLSIFVLSQVMAHSSIGIGDELSAFLSSGNADISTIIVTSYFGTLLTEAASWASAAGPLVHNLNNSVSAAWALGAGICAGSSSLITAATAGIILLHETADNEPQDRMTFGRYLITGLGFSAAMVVYYIVLLNVLF